MSDNPLRLVLDDRLDRGRVSLTTERGSLFSDIWQRTVFVVGGHRSGTTICARMIAEDTGHDLIIEDEFHCSNLIELSALLQYGRTRAVIQCPFLTDIVHDLNYLIDVDMDNALVVYMRRPLQDIVDSEVYAPVDFDLLNLGQRCRYRVNTPKHISEIKWEAWQDQRAVIPHTMVLDYKDLSAHRLWRDDHTSIPFEHEVRRGLEFNGILDATAQNVANVEIVQRETTRWP